MISEREKKILKIIVEEYIKTASPVSSSHICKEIKCSSATVRNEMVYLEELGFLEKNHFASGRTPSEAGYKYYVDYLMQPKNMTGEDMLKLQTIFKNQSLDLSDTIKKSIEIVSEITNYTSIVLGTSAKVNRLKQVEIVPLEENKILTLVITDKGVVEHKNLYLPNTISTLEVQKTVELINKLLVGTPINEVSEKLEYEIKPIIGKYVKQHEILYNAFYDAFSEFTNQTNNDVHFVGKNNFLKQPEFNNIEKVKEVLSKFEDVNSIKAEENNGINIYIGSESEISDEMSVVKTKYNLGGEEGTIAIIGPKRMEYDKVVSLLDYIKENIGGDNE
ncbi:MAG: heat-inducible transcriptional repressor HrcA [Erysipelotrichaceae bacterium]|nr:heat-inducible transcriptional repressor HrcA [Erysipelotrichaceae bacterium]